MERNNERKQQVRLRITLRGRIVLAFTLTILLLSTWGLMSIIGASKADAYISESESLASGASSFETVVVFPGDTLWDIASMVAPQSDPRDVMSDLLKFNQLSDVNLLVGQELAIPPQYSQD